MLMLMLMCSCACSCGRSAAQVDASPFQLRERYTGDWVEGRREGTGTFFFANGSLLMASRGGVPARWRLTGGPCCRSGRCGGAMPGCCCVWRFLLPCTFASFAARPPPVLDT